MRTRSLIYSVLCFREALKHHYNLKQYWLEVDLEDLRNFDESLADKLVKLPSHYLSLVHMHLCLCPCIQCICVHLCMCACMCVCAHMYLGVCVCACVCVPVHICVCTPACLCMHVGLCACTVYV